MSLPTTLPTITLLIPNMHCPSCVESITQLLSPLRSISNLNVSLLLHTVTFTPNSASPSSSRNSGERGLEKEVTEILQREGGFVVENPLAEQLSSTPPTAPGGKAGRWFRSLGWNATAKQEAREKKREEIRRRIHWENCEACREGRSHDELDTGVPAEADASTQAKGGITKTVFSIGGMTCASCTQSVTGALKSQKGIVDVDINLLASSGIVRHESSLSAEAIKEMIEDTGFEAEIISSSQETDPSTADAAEQKYKTILSIEGMTCSSCSSTVDKALRGVSGVEQVTIDVLGNKGTVLHASTLSAEDIAELIEDSGYGATVVSSQPVAISPPTAERRVKIIVHGIYCNHCIVKLNAYLGTLPVKSTPFHIDNHVTEIAYTPREPYTIRDLLRGISGVSPEFEAAVVKETSLSDRSKEIQRREMRVLFAHWVVAFIFTIPTFIIGIVGMALLPSMDHFRMLWMRKIWGAANLGTIVLWPIATVVQFGVGRLFYERAFASMKPHLRRLTSALRSHTRGKTPPSRPLTWRAFFNFGSMDLLVVLSTSVSYFASLAMLIIDVTSPPSMESVGSYFDSCVFLIMFILLGRVLEAYAKSRTTDAVSLLGQLRPETALLVDDSVMEQEITLVPSVSADVSLKATSSIEKPKGEVAHPESRGQGTRMVPVEHLEKGDLILIPPGSLPPTDGVVVSGHTTFDESSLTGESRPIKKGPGDEVFTGTTNLSGAVTIRITTTSGETMLEKIMRAVSEASGHKAPIEKLAETLTGVFVPSIVYLAIAVLIVWLSLAGANVLAGHGDGKGGGKYFFAIEFAIATLVVACPCGIGLAVPCANAVGTGLVAKEGVLATTGGEAFLGATQVGVVVLDKTGTLTIGKSAVTDQRHWPVPSSSDSGAVSLSPAHIDAMVRAVERGSTHPLAQGIVANLDAGLSAPQVAVEVKSTEEVAGRGVVSTVQVEDASASVELLIGNAALLSDHGVALDKQQEGVIDAWTEDAKSVVLVATRLSTVASAHTAPFHLVAAYGLSDPPRESTAPALAALRGMGLQVKMLSGDNPSTAIAVGRTVGIAPEDVIAGVSPQGKAEVVRSLQSPASPPPASRFARLARLARRLARLPLAGGGAGTAAQPRRVMFVGDGLNDSVALAAADVSVAMGHGSQATLAGSDFVLLSSSLAALPTLLRLSRKITRRQKLNLAWACVFNMVCLPFAAGVFYPARGIRLSPVWSAVIMACSSLSVVCSSLALRWGV